MFQPAESTLLSIIDRSYDPRLNFVLAVLKAPGEISLSVRSVRAQCASVENNSEGVPFSMQGRACQDVRVTRFNRSYKCAVEQIWYTLVIMDGEMDWGFYFSAVGYLPALGAELTVFLQEVLVSIDDKGPSRETQRGLPLDETARRAGGDLCLRHSVRSHCLRPGRFGQHCCQGWFPMCLDVSSLSDWMCNRCLFDMTLERPRVDADVLLRNRMVLPLRRFGFRGTP